MAILNVVQYPDLRLKRKGHQVADPTNACVQKVISDMLETLASFESCAGLAATQLAIENPPSITVINSITPEEKTLCLINPQIIFSEGEATEEEGCMSINPSDVYSLVKRATKIKVKALNQYGNHIEFIAENFLARCIQHEVDHLNGILYLDRISPLKRLRIEKKIIKLKDKQK